MQSEGETLVYISNDGDKKGKDNPMSWILQTPPPIGCMGVVFSSIQ